MRSYLPLRSSLHLTLATGVMLASAFSPLAVSRADAQSSYYVSSAGSDSNNGSQSYPFATIQHADRVVQPGDTVVVLNGTYSGDILLQSSGTAASPITYVAQNKWQAKLVGTTSGDGTAVIRITGGHLIIKNFDITGPDAAGILLASSGTTASYNQAIGDYVHDLVTPCDSDGGSALNTGGGSNYLGISHDDFIGNLVVNIHPPSGCTANTSGGIYEAVPYGVVANNIVMNVGGAAIQSWHNAYHETFFGNVAMNSKDGIVVGDGDAPGGVTNDYTLVQNNITINNSYCGICEDGLTGTHNIYADNLSYGNSSNILLLNGLAAIGTITANPQFVNNTGTATGDYRLQSTSPARGAGLALAGVATDFLGTPRPQSGVTDIGACLFVGTSTQ